MILIEISLKNHFFFIRNSKIWNFTQGQWGGFYDASQKYIGGNTNPYTFMSLNYVQMEMTSDDPPVAVKVRMEGPEQVGNCQAVSRSLVIDGLAGRKPSITWKIESNVDAVKINFENKLQQLKPEDLFVHWDAEEISAAAIADPDLHEFVWFEVYATVENFLGVSEMVSMRTTIVSWRKI